MAHYVKPKKVNDIRCCQLLPLCCHFFKTFGNRIGSRNPSITKPFVTMTLWITPLLPNFCRVRGRARERNELSFFAQLDWKFLPGGG